MNLTITPNITQYKNSQQTQVSRLNTAGGGGSALSMVSMH